MWQIPVNFNVYGTTIQAMAFCLIMSRCIKVEAMLSTADKNKDNTINYCEFRVRPALEIKQKLEEGTNFVCCIPQATSGIHSGIHFQSQTILVQSNCLLVMIYASLC